VIFEGVKNLMRVQAEILHELPEHVPFDLSECKTYMLIRQQGMFASASFVEGAVEDTLG
jgi:hypothetical protein